MKKILLTGSAAILLLAGWFLVERDAQPTAPVMIEPLDIGVEANVEPFSYVDVRGELTGFDVEFAREVCRMLRRDCRNLLLRHALPAKRIGTRRPVRGAPDAGTLRSAVVARLHATTVPSDFCPRFRGGRPPKFPCRTFGTRHVPMPRPAGRVAKRLRRVRVGFVYHDPLDHGRPFG